MRYREIISESVAALTVHGWKQWREGENDFHHDWDDFDDDIEAAGGLVRYTMRANQWIKSLPDPLILYRGIHVPDPEEWIKNHVRGVGRDLGVSWTEHFEIAINENGPDGGYGRPMEGETNLVLVARVEPQAVDWYCSAAMQTVDTEEIEIRLQRGASVFLTEVCFLDLGRPTRQTGQVDRLTNAFGDAGADYDHHHISKTVPLNLTLQV